MLESMTDLYSHVDGENLKVDLTMAKALGGKGDAGKTNPEELFAAGYGRHPNREGCARSRD